MICHSTDTEQELKSSEITALKRNCNSKELPHEKMEKGLLQLLGKLPELKAGLKTVEDEDRLPESKLLPAILQPFNERTSFCSSQLQ